jgi:RNA polymerase sigma-70 factor (ECF subfamily)
MDRILASPDQTSDEDLLALYAGGDRMAAAALTSRHAPRCLAVAMRMLGDRAESEDVAQEALLRLWRIAPDWRRGEAQISTWLYRVVFNLCTDHLRKRRRGGVALDDVPEPEDGAKPVAETLQDRARAEALQKALDTLPDRQRQAVILRHIEGLSNPEIADAMDIGVEAVESLTARGKRALAARLAGQRAELGYEDG